MNPSNQKQSEKLHNEIQRLLGQVQDYKRLISVLQTIGSSLEVDEILRKIIEGALHLCNAQQGSIMVFDPSGKQEAKTVIRKGEPEGKQLNHYLNTLLCGWTRRYKKPLLTNNLTETFGPKRLKEKYQSIASVLSVPLELHGEIVGVINLISLNKNQTFGERELQLLQILAAPFAQFIANARLHEALFTETQRLREEVQEKYAFHGIIGQSLKIQEVFALLERVIPTEGRVLLEGESGTGKELIARVLHYGGPRKDGPFVSVDCGALPANLLESELFGYFKGAFTGAHRDKKGLFEEAHGGTLFLDEIVNMPNEVQTKFLRALEEGEIRPVGSTQTKKVDVRIIAAASDNLRAQVEAGQFREDLYYRLNVVNISLPPLRERKEDIAILANHFLNKMAKKYDKMVKGFKAETITYLENYAWPGNVRELENAVERMVILAEENLDYIPAELLPQEIRSGSFEPAISLPQNLPSHNVKTMKDTFEKKMLLDALTEHDWNQSAAARALGIAESTLRYKMQKYGIKKL
ncbi:MAG: sigma 54-interacting transcriptional regulator [bacterium]